MHLSAADYVLGCVTTILVVSVLGWGSWRVRNRLLPEWDGALARTAEITIATAAVVVTSLLLAAGHALWPWPTLVAFVLVGLAMGALGTTASAPSDRSAPEPPDGPTIAIVAAAGAALLAQWAAHVAVALDGGMTQLDTLYYHGPYSAQFLQDGTIGDLAGLGTSGSRLYPLNTELWHTLAAMPFGTDLLSPLVNLVLLAVLAVAAWAIGQPRGLGALSLLGATVVASFPAFVATQAGQASSDLAAAAFLLSAAAMLLASDLRPAPTTLAGIAAGIAVGSKLSVAAPVVALTIGVVVVGLWGRHLAAVAGWCLGLGAVVGGWFVRNWLLVDNPFPWFDIDVGPVHWRASAGRDAGPLVDTITDLSVWRSTYLPEIPQSMGRAWPIALAVLVGTALFLVVRRRGVARVLGAAVLLSLAAHVITPQTGGIVFGNNLRFLHPALLLAGGLVALLAVELGERGRRLLAGGLALLVLVNLLSPHEARVPMWPGGRGPVAAAIVAAAAVVVGTGALMWSRRHDGRLDTPRVRWLAAGVAIVVVVSVGWPVQEHFLETRYVTTDLARVDLYQPFHALAHQRVAVLGEPEVYPMFGPDLSNDVVHLTNKDRRADLPSCLAWRQALTGRYDYIAVLPFFIIPMDMEADELVGDPGATVIARSDLGTVYRIDGPLATDVCAADQRP